MKSPKGIRLIALSILLSVFGLSKVQAQTDSIYGLNCSVINDTIIASFNSTYSVLNLQYLHVKVTDVTNPQSTWTFFAEPINNYTSMYGKVGQHSFSFPSQGIVTYTIVDAALISQFIGKPLKIEFYLENNVVAKTEGTSLTNVLSFEYDPLATSVNEIKFNGELGYKYFDLNGNELLYRPINSFYIEVLFKQGQIVSSHKKCIAE
jgi:hypothetical protein